MQKLNVIYEDNHIIVVEKLPNIPSQADKTEDIDMLTIIKEYIKEKYNKPGNVYLGLVHRLDRPVGGVMVFAKTKQAAANLSGQIREKQANKYYYAVVCGKPKEKQARLVDYLKKDGKNNTSFVVPKETKGAKRAELWYKVLQQKENKSLLCIDLKTGRHHQIRVQLSHMGCPIYGDSKYAGAIEAMPETYRPLALCAYKIAFVHPKTKEKMEFQVKPEGEAFSDFRIE